MVIKYLIPVSGVLSLGVILFIILFPTKRSKKRSKSKIDLQKKEVQGEENSSNSKPSITKKKYFEQNESNPSKEAKKRNLARKINKLAGDESNRTEPLTTQKNAVKLFDGGKIDNKQRRSLCRNFGE